MKASILLVEDEERLARFVELELLHEGYQVEKSGNGREALNMALQNHYDLILLDIMLPGLNGLEVLRRLLNEKDVPVILLTARDAVMDKVSGLDAGAVDYITKPFAIEELLARIRVALKLHAGHAAVDHKTNGADGDEGVLRWQDLVLDDRRHQVRYAGHEITLTNREFLRPVQGYSSEQGLRLRLRGRDKCRGCLHPLSAVQDRRRVRHQNDPDSQGSRLCHQIRGMTVSGA